MLNKSRIPMVTGLLLLAAIQAVQAGEVTARTEPLTLPWSTSTPGYAKDPKTVRAMQPVPGSQKPAGDRTFTTVVLENEYVRVQAVPELGGVVYRAVYKPANGGKGTDFFYCEQKVKDWLPWWESGVKLSFPYYEHGLSTDNQPASYTIIKNDDGSVTLAQFMDFARHNEAYQRRRYGRFSTMFATQLITLKPGEGTFSITFRMTNTSPFRQGRRMWTDTLLPRTDTPDGPLMGAAPAPAVTTAELVYPTTWVSDHAAASLREFAGKTKLSDYNAMMSLFAWEPLGFAGLYYPATHTSRLRICDPTAAPGAKFWFVGEPPAATQPSTQPAKPNQMFNYVELWGGTDHIFEGIENWIGPGESYAFTYTYALVPNSGYPLMVNPYVAVTRDPADQTALRVAALRNCARLEVAVDGKPAGTPAATAKDGLPFMTLPAEGGKTYQITMDGKSVYQGPIPPKVPAKDAANHDRINDSIKGKYNSEMRGNADEWSNTFEQAIGKYPDGSTDKGRVLYRAGKLDAALECLTKATAGDADDGEAWHLLGVTQLEKGDTAAAKGAFEKAVGAKRRYVAAQYYLALLAIAADTNHLVTGETEKRLTALVKEVPSHHEAQLLLAWGQATGPKDAMRSTNAAVKLAAEDPADPRVQYILWKGGEHVGQQEAAAAAKARLDALLKEPGAQTRVDEFVAATQGKFTAPARLQ